MKTLIAASLAALLLGVSAASAQPFNGRGYDNGYGRHYDDHRSNGYRGDFRHGPNRVWVRGERFAPSFGRYVVVDDWRAFRLRRPSFGYHWVRVGDDFLLISNRNGVIADVIFGGDRYNRY